MKRPVIGIFKFTSCDGCQLSLLSLDDEFLNLVNLFEVAYFREACDNMLRGRFDIALVEGSLSTDQQMKDIVDIRERSRHLITIGACATAGGLQALRNLANLEDYKKIVYPSPEMIQALPLSSPISDIVHVDYELWGCPINSEELSETLASFLIGKKPMIPAYSLCMDCKAMGVPCLLVARSEPCLGPVARSGCGVLCPSLGRPCYGCFGPRAGANIPALFAVFRKSGLTEQECELLVDSMNTSAYRKVLEEKAS